LGIKLFVYGTLRRGEISFEKLGQATTLAEQAWTKGTLYETIHNYPALRPGDDHVYGELYEISEEALPVVDEWEGYVGEPEKNLYYREQKMIQTDRGHEMAWVYFLSDSKLSILKEKIELGDFRVFQYVQRTAEPLYYFAYGSCMDHERFIQADVDHYFQRLVGRGHLEGYSLLFTAKTPTFHASDIVEVGGAVEGKVYEVPKEALDYLWEREGVDIKFYRPAVVQVIVNGGPVDCLTFTVINKAEEGPPTHIYGTEILRGGKDCLSEDYLRTLQKRLADQFSLHIDF
jgi:gamma-glutamylcyclotransferase (GGCT)/AIG2-like uncharacterized protein YtfP